MCAYKSTFVDAARISGREELAASHGIFPRDPTLKDFLREKPACLVTLRCIWNYARSRTAEQCRDVLEKYVVRGGDGGLTLATVRRSCGLAPNENVQVDDVQETLDALAKKPTDPSPATADPAKHQVSTVQATIQGHKEDQKEAMRQIRQWLVDERKEWFTVAQLKNAKAKYVFPFSKQDAQEVVQKMVSGGQLLAAPAVLPKVGHATLYIPLYACKKLLGEVVSLDHDANMVFTEEYSVKGVQSRLAGDCSRSVNILTLAESYKKRFTSHTTTKKKGAPRRGTDPEVAVNNSKLSENLRSVLEKQKALYQEVLQAKSVEQENGTESTEPNLHVTLQRSYFYPMDIRCRRFSTEHGAQNVSRLTRAICFPDTADYDISASMFTIVVQLVDLVQPEGVVIPSWRAVAANRRAVCANKLKCTEAVGKQILMEVANGAAVTNFPNIHKQGLAFLTTLSTESRLLRWLACSQLHAEYLQLRRSSRNHWPEANIFAVWWNAAEDYILQAMLSAIQRQGFAGHISCHFDGLLLRKSLVKSVEENNGMNLISFLQEAVSKQTPFKVTLKDKTVSSLDELLAMKFKPSEVTSELGQYVDTLTAIPNSIPAAMVFLGADLKRIIQRLREESPANTKAETRHLRQYSDWNGCGQLHFIPRGACTAEASSDFLLHIEFPESSLCLGVKVLPDEAILLMRGGRVYEGSMPQLFDVLEALYGCKETFCFDVSSETTEIEDCDLGFLDLLAGSSTPSSSRKRPASVLQDQSAQNEGEVEVGTELRELLQQEVAASIDAVKGQSGANFPPTTCPCCPWRQFERRQHLLRHLEKQHTRAKRFSASGTKQLRIAAALYDHDRLHDQNPEPSYLARSSALLRRTVKGAMPRDVNAIDKKIRCVWHADGPEFVRLQNVQKATGLRRVGNMYYDRGFAEAFLHAASVSHGSLHKVQTHFLRTCRRENGQLASLIPRGNNGFWLNVMEDLMTSPLVESYTARLLEQCREAKEFRYLSIDATFKINLKILGQASFHSSAAARSDAIIPEEDAAYRTLTCRGRTGATLVMCGVRSEKARVIANALGTELSDAQRQQVLHIASDAPSQEMLQTLQEIFPNLASLALDAMHIVMVYDQNMNNRRSTGGKWLAVIMNKFRRRHPTRTQTSWGAFYTGARPGPDAQDVRCMRERLQNPDMPEDAAMRVLDALDPDVPWLTEVDFLEALLAHVSFFHEELQKVSYSGISLHRLIVNIGSSSKFQWLLNDTRYRHAVDARELALLPSGTTSNESLHHEINAWFRETASRRHDTM